jgi:hypothetical protein
MEGLIANIVKIPSQTKHSAAYISHSIIFHYFLPLHRNCGSSAINSHWSPHDKVENRASRVDPNLEHESRHCHCPSLLSPNV